MNPLVAADIKVGHTYSARRPARVGAIAPVLNDRQVLWVDVFRSQVQYDSPTVRNGRRQPKVTMAQFLRWAKEDVTNLMPPGDWRKGE